MKKTDLIKGFLIILVGVLMLGTTGVFADDDDEFNYIFDEPSENTTNTSNNKSNTNSNTNKSNTNSNTNKSNTNTNKSNTNTNKNNTNTATNNTTNKNNASSYNNTNTNNLPKTGVEDAIPTMVLVVVFGISAVYAYKKINEYKKL